MKTQQPMRAQTNAGQSSARIILFPARTPEKAGKRVFYLLSVRQVVEMLPNPDIMPVPFGPRHAVGVSQWRGRVLPVLSLEDRLGIDKVKSQMPVRSIVVRGVTTDADDQAHESLAVFNVGAAFRQMALPVVCDPLPKPSWVTHPSCLSGAYRMQAFLLLALDINTIINTEGQGN